MSTPINIATLRQFRYFQHLPDAALQPALAVLQPLALTPGQTLFRCGDPGDSVFLLVSGQVEIRVPVPNQPDRTLTTLEAGAVFGEVGSLLNEPRSAMVVACGAAEVWRLPRDAFHAALERHEAWACPLLMGIAQVLARRLLLLHQELANKIDELGKSKAKAQAAKVAELEQLRTRLFTEWSF